MSRIIKDLTFRDKFYILTNGKQTEKNYFELVKAKKSIYQVIIKFFNDDPLQLVKHACQYLKEANQVWCVFDIDNTHSDQKLIPTLALANELGVNIAFSNVAFEVWLISHFEKCERSMNAKELIERLNIILLKELNLKNIYYSKDNKDLLRMYFIPKIKQAINNSKIVHQKKIKESNNYKIWEWNPCTNVYELVEALELQY